MPELTPEERQRIYLEEKARIEAREQIEAEAAQKEEELHRISQVSVSDFPSVNAPKPAQGFSNAATILMTVAIAAVIIFFVAGTKLEENKAADALKPHEFTPEEKQLAALGEAFRQQDAANAALQQEKVKVQVKGPKWTYENYGYDYVRGSVLNGSGHKVQYWKVTAEFLDSKGNTIDTAYTNSIESLQPGAAKRFEIMLSHPPTARKFRAYVEEVQFAN